MTEWITDSSVKALMGSISEDHDTELAILIPFTQTLFETMSNRTIDSGSYTEQIRVRNGNEIVLTHYPVIEIIDLDFIESDWNWQWNVSSDDYIKYESGVISFDKRFTGTVDVDYTAGYTTIPLDICRACELQVIDFLNQKSRLGLTSKGMTDATTSYNDIPVLPFFQLVVNKYTNPVPKRIIV
jgi:hypothetical protein